MVYCFNTKLRHNNTFFIIKTIFTKLVEMLGSSYNPSQLRSRHQQKVAKVAISYLFTFQEDLLLVESLPPVRKHPPSCCARAERDISRFRQIKLIT